MVTAIDLNNVKLGDTVALKTFDEYYYKDRYLILKLVNENNGILSDWNHDLLINEGNKNFEYIGWVDEYDNKKLYDPNCEEVIKVNEIYKTFEMIIRLQKDIHKIRVDKLSIEELKVLQKDLEVVWNRT